MAKTRKREALDMVDAEHVIELLGHPGWQLFSERIAKELVRQRAQLEEPRGEVETASLRGFIRGLKLLLEVPQNLIHEGKQRPADEDRV